MNIPVKGNTDLYKSLVDESFSGRTSKIASSSPAEVKKKLGGLSPNQIEILANELDALVKTSGETVESKSVPGNFGDFIAKKKEEAKSEDKPADKAEEKAEDKPAEKSEDKAEEKAEEKSEDKPAEKAEDAKEEKKAEEVEVKASEKLRGILEKGAAVEDQEAQIMRQAFELAQSIFKEAGYGVSDYVYNLLGAEEGTEKVAMEIATRAEYIGELTNQPAMMVARDIVSRIGEVASETSESAE